MNTKAVGHYIIIKPLEIKVESSIVIPDASKPEISRGEVVSVGKLVDLGSDSTDLVGKIALFGRHKREHEIVCDRDTYLIYADSDIYAIETPDSK